MENGAERSSIFPASIFEKSRTSSARMRPKGCPSSLTTTSESRRASTSCPATSSAEACGLTVITSSSSSSDDMRRSGDA